MAGADGGGDHSRQPRNWQGLFRFCQDATKDEDSSAAASRFVEMDPERRKWLEEALANLAESDPIKVMLQDMKVLAEETEDLETKERAIEDLQVHVEDLDLANDFHKIGGYTLLTGLLHHRQEGLRWRAGDLIATLMQNNPYSQNAAQEAGLVPTLLHILDNDDSNKVRVKALYALSSLIRDFPEGQKAFLENGGFSVLGRAMSSGEEKLILKTSFLIRALCQEQPKYKDILHDTGMVDQLISMLRQDHNSSHEYYMGALAFLSDHQGNREQCRKPELGLHKLLIERQKLIKDKSEYQEELEHCQKIMSVVFCEQTGGPVDR